MPIEEIFQQINTLRDALRFHGHDQLATQIDDGYRAGDGVQADLKALLPAVDAVLKAMNSGDVPRDIIYGEKVPTLRDEIAKHIENSAS